jgi:hypothetical protein
VPRVENTYREILCSYNGTKAHSDGLPLAAAAAKRLGIDSPDDSYTPEIGDTIAAGEPPKDLLVIRNPPEDIEQQREFRRQLRGIKFSSGYESVYGEIFSTSSTPEH